jgi:tetratricopeptide (TPR) repeat protein
MGRPEDSLLDLFRSGKLPANYAYPAYVKHLEPRLRDSLARNRRLLNTALAQNSRTEEGALPFHFDYMSSEAPNAIAFQYEGLRFIIATIPMVQLLLRTSEVLSRSSSVISLLGFETLEPLQQEGLSSALFLLQLSFLALHEYAHHLLGHVATSSKSAFNMWTEALDEAKTKGLERQAQEIHADFLAAHYLLDRHLRAQDSIIGMLRLDRKSIADEELLGLFLVAVTAFFESAPAAFVNERQVHTLGHPPRDLRMVTYVRDSILGWCRKNRPELEMWFTDNRLQNYMVAVTFAVSGADGVKRHVDELNHLRTLEGQKYFMSLEEFQRQELSALKHDEALLLSGTDLTKSPRATVDPEQPSLKNDSLEQTSSSKPQVWNYELEKACMEQAHLLRDRHAKLAKDGELEVAAAAMQEMRELLERYPEDLVLPGVLSSVLKHHCDELALAGQADQAFTLVEEEARLLQRYPDDATIPGMFASALSTACYIYQDSGRTQESARQLERLVELGKEYPNDVLVLKVLALIVRARARLLASAGSLGELTVLTATARLLYQRYPGDERVRDALQRVADAWYRIGVISMNTDRDSNEAKRRMRQAVELDPRHSDAHRELAMLLSFQDHAHSAARAQFEEALKINPNDAEAHCGLGIILSLFLQDKEAAREHFLRAQVIDPDLADLASGLARS